MTKALQPDLPDAGDIPAPATPGPIPAPRDDVPGYETSLLGAVLIDPTNVEHLYPAANHFLNKANIVIAKTMRRLDDAGVPIDAVTVRKNLNGKFPPDVDPHFYIANLMSVTTKASNARHWAQQILADRARVAASRNLQAAQDALAAGDSQSTVEDLIEAAKIDLDDANPGRAIAVQATAGELAVAEVEIPRPIVPGLLDEGNRGYVFADAQGGKSLLLLGVLAHIAGGFTIAGCYRVPEPQAVAMLFLEDRVTPAGNWPPRILWRMQSILAGLQEQGHDTTEAEANLLLWCGSETSAGLRAAAEHGSRLTIIDSWNCVCTDDDTDKSNRGEIRRIFDQTHDALGNEAFLFLDHVNKGGGKSDDRKDADRHYGSVGKRGVSDLMLMLSPADSPEGDVAVTLKATKGRDGLDVPEGGRVFVWRGLPTGCRLPLDTPVPLRLEHLRDNAGPQDLGQRALDGKLERWKRTETFIRAAGGTRPITEIAELLEIGTKTVRRWASEDEYPDTPFEMAGRGVMGMKE